MRVVAVTGASGFIGRHLVARVATEAVEVRRLLRRPDAGQVLPANVTDLVIGDLAEDGIDWSAALTGTDVVIHLAAVAHRSGSPDRDELERIRHVNVAAVADMSQAAADAGVRRFVFVSSIGVNGSNTVDRAFTEADAPAPRDAYAASKLEAERVLAAVATARGMEYVILRPPLVYGSGAPGNFHRLLRLVRSGWPLPLGAVRNRRSFVSVANLCDALWLAATAPAARNEVFLVSDGAPVSTPQLIRCLAAAHGVRCRLLAIPVGLLRATLSFAGRARDFERLCGSLEIDSGKIRRELGWRPRETLQDGLRGLLTGG